MNSAGIDAAVVGTAAAEAAALLADNLGLDAQPGDPFDLWGEPPAELGSLADKTSKAWTTPLLGPLGQCGDLSLVLPTGARVPGEGRVASALAGCVSALGPACGADHVGQMQRSEPQGLLVAQPGQRASGVPLVSGGEWAGLLVLVTNPSLAELPHLDPAPGPGTQKSIAALADVEMTVSVELGRTKIPIKDLLAIHNGSVVQLDRPVSHPVDIFVHGTLIARGEVVVVDECFAVRVTELLTGD